MIKHQSEIEQDLLSKLRRDLILFSKNVPSSLINVLDNLREDLFEADAFLSDEILLESE